MKNLQNNTARVFGLIFRFLLWTAFSGMIILGIITLCTNDVHAFFDFFPSSRQELYIEAEENLARAMTQKQKAQAILWEAENYEKQMQQQLWSRQSDLAWEKMGIASEEKDLIEIERLKDVINTLQGFLPAKQ